jgi:glycerate 2-kinase
VEGSGIHPLRILVAPDSFKGSLTAAGAAGAIHRGILRVLPDAAVTVSPVSDGGDGLLDVVGTAVAGTMRMCTVHGPLPDQMVPARWFHARDDFAVVEMAEAAGLMRVPPAQRDPKITTTFGVGELMQDALRYDVRRGIIGIGGSGTNDGGAGMAQALGVALLDAGGEPLEHGGASLQLLDRIVTEKKDPRLTRVQWIVAGDVTNPLCGRDGATRVYGPQKGATESDLDILDNALERYAAVIEHDCGVSVRDLPGAGAAGGLGAGLVAFCGATLQPGIDVVLDMIGFDELLKTADVVITGEGKLDAQTRYGKAVDGVIRRAHRHHKEVLGVFGEVDGSLTREDLSTMFAVASAIRDERTDLETAMREAGPLLETRAAAVLQRFMDL